ncbi:MAG: indole-3-glycerol-phosphate synthase TrpC, partial [Desulfobacterales bacterium]|nr:indole-3-glycerol-phosphate synthase TrpC [Desulfobacterales bacterium]
MILDEIVAHKKKEIATLREVTSLASLKRLAEAVETPRGFRQALARSSTIALIAEVKKSSPSAGLIRKDVDPVRIGKIYEDSGASAISVLTDEQFFNGSLA